MCLVGRRERGRFEKMVGTSRWCAQFKLWEFWNKVDRGRISLESASFKFFLGSHAKLCVKGLVIVLVRLLSKCF